MRAGRKLREFSEDQEDAFDRLLDSIERELGGEDAEEDCMEQNPKSYPSGKFTARVALNTTKISVTTVEKIPPG